MPQVFTTFLSMLVMTIWLLVLARVIVSWTMPQGGGQLIAFLYQVTEPILAPIRRILPPAGGIDWSPLIAMLILTTLVRLLRF